MNERGITLQTTIVTAVLALAAAAAGIVIYNVVSDESEEISENAVAADGVDRFWEADDDSGDGGDPNLPPDDNGDPPPQTDQEVCESAPNSGVWNTATSTCDCPLARDWSSSAGTCVASDAEVGCMVDGTWTETGCTCPADHTWNGVDNCDEDDTTNPQQAEQDACEAIGGMWESSACVCPATLMGAEWIYDSGSDSGTCECPTGEIEKDGICIEAETTTEYDTRHVYVNYGYSCAVVGDIGSEGVFVTSETIDNSDDSVNDSTPSTFQCWGISSHKTINEEGTRSTTPVPNPTTDSFKVLNTGPFNICYITSSDTLKCLGNGDRGRLARSASTNTNTPQLIPSLTGVESASVAYFATCTIASNGETADNVWCFGHNRYGAFGAGHAIGANKNVGVNRTPVKVAGLEGATQVAVTLDTTCAIIGSGSSSLVKCLGENGDKELGQGDVAPDSTRDSTTPLTVSDANGAKAISAGLHHFCIITSDDRVACWGKHHSTNYNLGFGATGNVGTPREISGVTEVTHLDSSQGVTTDESNSCFLYESGSKLRCVGSHLILPETTAPSSTSSPTTFTSVQTGLNHVCVTTSENKIWCLANAADSNSKIRIGQTDAIVANRFYEVAIS